MTKKLRFILLIILTLILIAMISRRAALVWMTVPFFLYVLTGILAFPEEVSLGASRIISHNRCKANTLITMTIVVENNGQRIPCLQFHESIDPKIKVTKKINQRFRNLSFQCKAEMQYTFLAPRGKYFWDSIQITVSDPFSLFEKTIILPAEAEVVVLPQELIEKSIKLSPDHTLISPGLYYSRKPGAGVNFFGIREYLMGDPLRSIHWRLSARHPNQLFSKEFEREEMADVGLIVDGNSDLNVESGQGQLFDFSIQIASTIARDIIQKGNRLSLLVLGDRVARVFPGSGKLHLARILNQLAASQPGEKATLSTINFLPVKLFPSHALLILISPLSENDLPAITRLLARGYQVLVVSPDPIKFIDHSAYNPLAVRAAKLERKALLWKIREKGVKVIDWPPGENERLTSVQEYEKSGFSLKNKGRNLVEKLFEKKWFLSVIPILIVCASVAGILLGFSEELMIISASLALILWEIIEGNSSSQADLDFISRWKLSWTWIKPLVSLIGIGLLLSIGGLQIHVSLSFGIVVLAVLLLLFSLNRFYKLI